MKEKLIMMVLPTLIEAVLSIVSADRVKVWLDDLIDIVEEKIEQSESRVDDALLPVLKTVRGIFSIPDLPDS